MYIISKVRSLMRDGLAHSSVIGVEGGRWVSVTSEEWDSSAISIARVPSSKIVVVGEDGEVVARAGSLSVEEKLPGEVVGIRNAKTIAGHTDACGMQRQVFRRTGEAQWQDISAATR